MAGFEHPGSQTSKEIERKFLLPGAPRFLKEYEGESIRQGYLVIGADGSEARLRDREGDYTLTVKSKGDLVRGESETELNQQQFDKLWPATAGMRLEKVRFSIPYFESLVELDLYSGDLRGLVVAEVEFTDIPSAEAFSKPDWFGPEVTDNKAYKNQQLALSGRTPELPPEIPATPPTMLVPPFFFDT